jgi:lysophospholipase L1-like esterase
MIDMKKDMTVLKAIIEADYKRHVKKFDQISDTKELILFGDSMMAYFPIKAFDLEDQVLNMGIPGDTTVGLLNRVDQVIRMHPKYVIINIGLNDFVLTQLSYDESLNNILEIRHQILEKCPNTEVYVTSLTPINQKDFEDQTYLLNRDKEDAVKLNKLLKSRIDHKYFIDTYDDLLDEQGDLRLDYTRDGIHLNQKGYQVYLKMINNILK